MEKLFVFNHAFYHGLNVFELFKFFGAAAFSFMDTLRTYLLDRSVVSLDLFLNGTGDMTIFSFCKTKVETSFQQLFKCEIVSHHSIFRRINNVLEHWLRDDITPIYILPGYIGKPYTPHTKQFKICIGSTYNGNGVTLCLYLEAKGDDGNSVAGKNTATEFFLGKKFWCVLTSHFTEILLKGGAK